MGRLGAVVVAIALFAVLVGFVPVAEQRRSTSAHDTSYGGGSVGPVATSSTYGPPEAATATLVVASDSGVILVSPAGESRVVSGPAWIALDDLAGGVVFQRKEPTYEGIPQPVWWYPLGATEPVAIVDPGPGQLVEPYDVVIIDGRPALLYTIRDTRMEPWVGREMLMARDLGSEGERTIAAVGVFEQHPIAVSAGGGRIFVSGTDSTGSWFELLDLGGNKVAWAANPHPIDDYRPKWVYGVMDPTGTTVVYTEEMLEPSAGTTYLVARTVDEGVELFRQPLFEGDEEWVRAVDFDGKTVVVTVESSSGLLRWAFSDVSGHITSRSATGIARLARGAR